MSNDNREPTHSSPQPAGLLKNSWFRWGLTAIFILAVYFVYVEIQTRLGEKALHATGLQLISLDDALQQAQAENKDVLVDVSAIWCPTCRRLDKDIFSNSDVKAAMQANYVFTRLEYESEGTAEFMKRHGVSGFPTLLILDNQGNKIRKLKLTFDPQGFIAQL